MFSTDAGSICGRVLYLHGKKLAVCISLYIYIYVMLTSMYTKQIMVLSDHYVVCVLQKNAFRQTGMHILLWSGSQSYGHSHNFVCTVVRAQLQV